jgi:membrane-associated phospholipid phosphatase
MGAAAGVLLLAVTWYLFHYVAIFKRADVSVLGGFAQLGVRPGVNRLTTFVAGLCDPQRYVFLAAIPVIVAMARRRWRVAAMLMMILLAANETTQLLKPLLAAPRDYVSWSPIGTGSWPSGHATAAMSLALCAVIAAPSRMRPAVAAVMSVFAIAVSYSFLELGWHYPSDVFGGFLVAATWTLLGVAALWTYEARRTGLGRAAEPPERPRQLAATPTVAHAVRPAAALLGAAALFVALVVLARPHGVITYVRAHEVFVIGACAIGALGLMLGSGLAVVLRRG